LAVTNELFFFRKTLLIFTSELEKKGGIVAKENFKIDPFRLLKHSEKI